MLIYFMVFGDTLGNIIFQLCYRSEEHTFFTSRLCWVITLGISILPIVLMKELKEMKAISIILFVSLAIFVLMFMIQIFEG